MEWVQVYNPAGSAPLSTILAAIPIVLLLFLLGVLRWKAWWAAATGLGSALAIAILVYGMPVEIAVAAAGFGGAFGLVPIGWIIVAAIFLYTMTAESGQFEIVKGSVASISRDRRIQALLVAFSFGAFIEGAAGFGTPVAISAALMIGLGFTPLHAAGLALIANTSPVAFGALGTPIITLSKVTGLDVNDLSAMAGRQLPFLSLIVPAWLVATMSGWKGLRGVWPAVLVSGGSFAIVQFLTANFLGPTIVDIAGGLISLASLTVFMRWWRPAEVWRFPHEGPDDPMALGDEDPPVVPRAAIWRAWMPWVFLSILVFVWGLPGVRTFLNGGTGGGNMLRGVSVITVPVPHLHNKVYRDVPVVARREKPEPAEYDLPWLSTTGTGIFVAAVISAFWLRIGAAGFLRILILSLRKLRWPLVTIVCMLALGFTTRYSGTDATLGLAFTRTGVLYPFFAALLGWLGVALTGSDTSSNALFGSLQKITAEQLGLSPVLITTANSTGGVMGKMVDAQSIVVSAAATDQSGQEGVILRYVFWHSIALACLVGLVVTLQAYVFPWMIPSGGVPR